MCLDNDRTSSRWSDFCLFGKTTIVSISLFNKHAIACSNVSLVVTGLKKSIIQIISSPFLYFTDSKWWCYVGSTTATICCASFASCCMYFQIKKPFFKLMTFYSEKKINVFIIFVSFFVLLDFFSFFLFFSFPFFSF